MQPFIGISSDILYSSQEIEKFAALFPNGAYRTLRATHGHDSFLVDQDALARLIKSFLDTQPTFSREEAAVA